MRSRSAAHAAAYRLHVLIGLVLSLGIVTAAFRMPWSGQAAWIGWGTRSADALVVTFEDAEPERPETGGDLAGRYRTESDAGTSPAAGGEEGDEALDGASVAPPEDRAPPPELPEPATLAPILEFAEVAPVLAGGLGSLYLHIRYPQAAIDRGIQGQLVLTFVVEPDGRASEIVVLKPLHPLCDSAAVRALREVAFVPGRQNGEAVRVRMRLPVRFRLVGPGGEAVSDSSLARVG